MAIKFEALADLGWANHFQSQLTIDELEASTPVRVVAVHRSGLEVAGPAYAGHIAQFRSADDDETDRATVGDWILLDAAAHTRQRLLVRRSEFKRRAAGTERRVQLIAANVDTLFVVTSCNQDFNVARLERYLVLARDAEVLPVIVLTKADLAFEPATFTTAAAKLAPGLLVECLDARSADAVRVLSPWCGVGQTVALVGSSGVGKSTLVNTLTGAAEQPTRAARNDDDRGRHTTTRRSLHRLDAGGWLLDTPGMRELQLFDAAAGIEGVFADIVALAADCRFSDCRHENEPGCAVRRAIEDGRIDAARWRRFRKLSAEEARNAEALHERRARERGFGKMVKSIVKERSNRERY